MSLSLLMLLLLLLLVLMMLLKLLLLLSSVYPAFARAGNEMRVRRLFVGRRADQNRGSRGGWKR